MNILVTGSKGLSGRHLTPLLAATASSSIYQTDILPDPSVANYFCCDLSSSGAVEELLVTVKPDQIYHLAGLFSGEFEKDLAANVLATKNILDAILKLKLRSRVLLIGSAAEYGLIKPEQNPVTENSPLNPVSIYGVTKAYQTQLMGYYHTVHGLDLMLARPFNLLGRGASEKLFVGRLYRQIEDYQTGKIKQITVGNLDSYRDYIAIEDACRHYLTIMNRGKSGEVYNVGSGRPVQMRKLLEQLLQEAGLTLSVVGQTDQPASVNKLDIKEIYADISNLLRLYPSG